MNLFKQLFFATALLASNGVLAQDSTIVELAVATDSLSTLAELVTVAGLIPTLSGDGPFTVFAPTNDAFAALPEGTLEALSGPDGADALTNILTYHVVGGNITSGDLAEGAVVTAVNGDNLTVTSLDPPMINDATVVGADVMASNGVVHVINTVLMPPAEEEEGSDMSSNTIVDLAVATPDLSTLVELVVGANLADALSGEGPLTVFAPTNDAFAALGEETIASLTDPANVETLTSILTYHVVGGNITSGDLAEGAVVTALNGDNLTVTSLDPPMINNAEVVLPDVMASNGVVHVINTVLLPGGEEDSNATTGEDEALPTILELAQATPELSTLVDLVVAADLADAIAGEGTYTIFAPTNDAFAALGEETLTMLTDPANVQTLSDVLMYHGLGNVVLSTDLAEGATVTALNEGTLTVTSMDPPTINNAQVVTADIMASNGVVHVINAVLAAEEEEHSMGEAGNATAGESGGCYDMGIHRCDCDADRCNQALCEADDGIWTAECPNHCTDCDGTAAMEGAEMEEPAEPVGTIVDLAVATPELSTLVELVTSAGLVETLSGEGPFTVFAPTNAAFEALDPEVLASVTGPENVEALTSVLTYHVLSGTIMSTDLSAGTIATTLNENSLIITAMDPPTINTDVVISAVDIEASNGVVHVIDSVLLPPSGEAEEEEPESGAPGKLLHTVFSFGALAAVSAFLS